MENIEFHPASKLVYSYKQFIDYCTGLGDDWREPKLSELMDAAERGLPGFEKAHYGSALRRKDKIHMIHFRTGIPCCLNEKNDPFIREQGFYAKAVREI